MEISAGMVNAINLIVQVIHLLTMGALFALGMMLLTNLTGIGSKAEQEYNQQPEHTRLLWIGLVAYSVAIIGYFLLVIALAQWR